ncbi:hypothetical protein FHS43_001896 [Streptosporangium becharense]|uniref:Uncharacterized protein n=1 Tax=Streptosporangium becharense TaxID=1816182 RepID=A0A7W9IBV5_9ACTN|nr:hypothetical protein [Streptosporangium becharense]MBB5817329.1 hypothetical protein [Streptosporangium becharense]
MLWTEPAAMIPGTVTGRTDAGGEHRRKPHRRHRPKTSDGYPRRRPACFPIIRPTGEETTPLLFPRDALRIPPKRETDDRPAENLAPGQVTRPDPAGGAGNSTTGIQR